MDDRRLLLVRHAVTDWNREGRFQGHRDPPLSADGRSEARLLADRIAADGRHAPARVIGSTLSRARETAEVIATACRAEHEPDDRLIELGQGDWEGRTHAELAVDDPDRYAAWRVAGGRTPPPGAEPLEAARRRVNAALDDVLASAAWPSCIVSHGGTLRMVAARLLDLDPERAWGLDLDNASLSVCVAGGGDPARWKVERWNDTRHLLGRLPTHVDEAEGEPLAL